MKRALPLSLLLLLALLGGGLALSRVHAEEDEEDDDVATKGSHEELAKQRQRLWDSKRYDEEGHVRMNPPKAGEWLFRFRETGQDEDGYKKECQNKCQKGRNKIYVTELGKLSKRCAAVQGPVREWIGAFFQLEVVRREPEELPKRYFVKERKQYDADKLMKYVKDSLEDDALVHVGLLDQDIFTAGLNFIFGQGSLAQRIGVYSFVRFQDGDETPEPLYRARCMRLCAHEMGHIVGMEHCVYYECAMNGANSLEEDDATPMHLCPVCVAKLKWNVGFDELEREKQLEKILTREKLDAEARWSQGRIARLEKARAPKGDDAPPR